MFILLKVKNCPAHIRGYLRRFLSEPDAGLFIGNCSKRVSEKIWNRITEEETGLSAYIVRSTSENEQGFTFEKFNLSKRKEIQDKDGLLVFGKNKKPQNSDIADIRNIESA